MKRTKLLKTLPCRAPEESTDKVTAVSQILRDGGKETLNIDLYYGGEMKARYFADREEMRHYTYIEGKWSTCCLDNAARMCQGKAPVMDGYYCRREYVFYSDEERERALNCLHTYSINRWEDEVNRDRAEKKKSRKKRRIEEMMSKVPSVPKEAEDWVLDEVFAGQILFVKKTGQRYNYSCTACGAHSWQKKALKHGADTVCPKCGAAVKVNARQESRQKEERVIILQAAGKDEWYERQFKAVCTWKGGSKELEMYEDCRAIIPKGETYGTVWYGQLDEADELEQEYWDSNPLNKRFWNAYLWPGNLAEVLPYGNLEHSGLREMARAKKKINVNKFIIHSADRPYMEYMIKGRFYKMAGEITDKYWYGKPDEICTYTQDLQSMLQIDGNRVNRLRTMDGGLKALGWLQYEEMSGLKISHESLTYLEKGKVDVDECRSILERIGSVNRMVNYLKKQKPVPGRTVKIWRDYLRMAENEGMDTSDDIVRFPKDLKARHDELVELANTRRDAERMKREAEKYKKLDGRIMLHLPEAKRYFYEDDTYTIVPAGRCQELVEEGRALHHCVGSSDVYMERMAKGETWILFLRKKGELEKPYYTVEIRFRDDEILQWYSEFDRKPDEKEIKRVLDKFRKNLKQQREQSRIPVMTVA